MILLSVTLEKCSGCAIMKNGKIIYSSSEERFSRIKADSSFPKKSILNGLKISKISPEKIDKVLISGFELSLCSSLQFIIKIECRRSNQINERVLGTKIITQ